MDTKDRITDDTPAVRARDDASEEGALHESQNGTRTQSVEDIRTQLGNHIGSLHFVNSALMVCVQALQQQDAEMDSDIALILQRTAGDKLDETIERIEAIALGVEFEQA